MFSIIRINLFLYPFFSSLCFFSSGSAVESIFHFIWRSPEWEKKRVRRNRNSTNIKNHDLFFTNKINLMMLTRLAFAIFFSFHFSYWKRKIVSSSSSRFCFAFIDFSYFLINTKRHNKMHVQRSSTFSREFQTETKFNSFFIDCFLPQPKWISNLKLLLSNSVFYLRSA